MASIRPLSVFNHQPLPPGPLPPRSLPRVERLPRRGPLLHAGPLAPDGEVLSLNMSQGCAHQCAFCSARAYPTYPGDGIIYLHEAMPERLTAELAARKRRPRAVYLSPSTDPFMPLAEVQQETARAVEVLADHGVEVWLMTRGFIRPAALRVLAAHRARVKVTVALTTLDRSLQRLLEPLAASPHLRLRQIRRLQELGIPVQVELAPLLPALTDTRTNLEPLLEALAESGIRRVTAGYAFLRSGIAEQLSRVLAPLGLDEELLGAYRVGPVLQAGTIAAARYLPRSRRQRGYAALMALAARLGITVSVCSLTNPDFLPSVPPPDPPPRQRLLPLFAPPHASLP